MAVQERDVRGDAREIDRGFNARVPAPDDGDALAAEERSVAVGTEGDAMAEEVSLSGNIETAPARARGGDERARAKPRAAPGGCVGLQSQSVAFGCVLLPRGRRAFRLRPVEVAASFRLVLLQLVELVQRPSGQFAVV